MKLEDGSAFGRLDWAAEIDSVDQPIELEAERHPSGDGSKRVTKECDSLCEIEFDKCHWRRARQAALPTADRGEGIGS